MKKEKWVDIDSLPHKKSIVDWKKSVGYKIKFQYNDISGYIEIVEWISQHRIMIKYNDTVKEITCSTLTNCKLGNLINARNYDWIYNIGDLIPDNIKSSGIVRRRYYKKTPMSNNSRFYEIECNRCHQLFTKFENDINKTGCPVCSNRLLIKGINDIWTTHPNIAEQLLNSEDGYKYSLGQKVFLDWICPKCKMVISGLTPMQVYKTVDSLVPCEKCSDGYSYPNKLMFNILSELGVVFEAEKTFLWEGLRNRRYDFYIPNENTIYEMHGGFHFDKRFPDVKINDKEKYELAIKNGIEKYIVVDCQKSDYDYILTNLKKTDLGQKYNLDKLDKDKIHKMATHNIQRIALELLKCHNYAVSVVADKLQINRATVSRYLSDAIKNRIIDETIVKECQLQNKIKQHYQLDGSPILCVELDKVFGSFRELEEYLKNDYPLFSSGSLCQALKRNGTAYGYHWQRITRKEFNQIKTDTPERAFGEFFLSEEDYHSPVLKGDTK